MSQWEETPGKIPDMQEGLHCASLLAWKNPGVYQEELNSIARESNV